MSTRRETGAFLVISALVYLAALGATGELRPGGKALEFLATVWLGQAAASLWSAWRVRGGAHLLGRARMATSRRRPSVRAALRRSILTPDFT